MIAQVRVYPAARATVMNTFDPRGLGNREKGSALTFLGHSINCLNAFQPKDYKFS